MARDHEETSTNKAGRKRGIPLEMPTTSSLVPPMSVEDLRSFRRVPSTIRLETSDGSATLTMGVRQIMSFILLESSLLPDFASLVSSLVKQFLHFTRAPPALVHPNVFRILMGCIVQNFLYQLDILLLEICFIYTLKLGIGGHLSMSAHSPQLQFVTWLLDSLETEAKGVVLVKGPWYETPGSPGLPFYLNQSLLFLGLFQLGGTCTPLGRLCF